MPDLTAPQLIALLREHPLTRKTLAVDFDEYAPDDVEITTPDIEVVTLGCPSDKWTHLRIWLTGACVEKHHELDIDLPVKCLSKGVPYYIINDGNEISHPTFLAAMLAALEKHDG